MEEDCHAARQQQQRVNGPQRPGRAWHLVGAVSYHRLLVSVVKKEAYESGYTHTAS